MGKKSEESTGDTAVNVNALFSIDNPFRRKPETSLIKSEITNEDKIPSEGSAKTRKRERDKGVKTETPILPSSVEDAIPLKRKKLALEAKGEDLTKKQKKRKRDDLELEHEKRQQLLVEDDAAAAASIVTAGEKRKAVDIAMDMLDTDRTSDDESKLLRTVFVGNLPVKIKRKALNREFVKFGEIDSVRIRSVPLVDTKAPRKAAVIMGKINEEVGSVNAYIVFKEEHSAQAALTQNMSQIGGNHIHVDMACPPRKKMKGESRVYDRKKTAFVGNLPFDVKDEEVYKLFCGFNPLEPAVEAVRVIRDANTSAGKGIAYVLFKTRDAANKVCRMMDLKIRDRTLRICHVKSDPPSNKFKEGRSRSLGSGDEPSGKGEKRKRGSTASMLYEGVRSSKSGVVKKASIRFPGAKRGNDSTRSAWVERKRMERKSHTNKRPAVAARKAKQIMQRKRAGDSLGNTRQNKRVRRQ